MDKYLEEKTITLTVAEFRKNIKASLDFALEGGIVIIDRMGQQFHLSHIPRGVGIMHVGIDYALGKDKGIVTEHTPAEKKSPVATPPKLKPAEYGKEWNEAAKHHLNVPQIDSGEKACCSKVKPCQHWSFDGGREVWTNSLSGREKGVEQ